MTQRHRAVTLALAGAGIVGAALTGTGLSAADPADPAPAPVTTSPVPPPPADLQGMTPNQPPVPAADPAVAPAAPVLQPSVPEIPNPTYGSGQYGGGVLGTLRDLWHQAQNPAYTPEEMGSGGGGAAPPPGAGAGPALPPGYVSINAPGSETPSTGGGGGGPATGRPALPPGYYSIDGPPPPGYEYTTPSTGPAAPTTTVVPAPGQ
ncbi:MAG TPA: hypothetical protein VMD51_00945 [Mycobacterium sp.]|nr:hypothetical protein [Mycobacterium sp.]